MNSFDEAVKKSLDKFKFREASSIRVNDRILLKGSGTWQVVSVDETFLDHLIIQAISSAPPHKDTIRFEVSSTRKMWVSSSKSTRPSHDG
jgi:hypothetical protein